MIKKIMTAVITFLTLAVCCSTAKAFFLFDLMNPSKSVPIADGPSEAGAVLKSGMKTLNNAQSLKAEIEKEVKNAYKSCCSDFLSIFEGKIPADPNGLSIQDTCAQIKVENPASIKKGFYELFLTLPFDESKVDKTSAEYMTKILEGNDENKAYKEYGEKFYEDTLLEIYNSVQVLESDLNNIQMQLDEAKKTLTDEEGSADDNSAIQKNSQALETMDSLLVIMHKVVAMRAQFVAANALVNNQLQPVYRGKDKKAGKPQSFNFEALSNMRFASHAVRGNQTLAFAQAEVEENGEVQAYKPIKSIADSFASASGISFNTVKTQELHPFAKNADKMQELNKLEPVSTALNDALEAHNAVVSLKGYKDSIKGYQDMVAMHKKILKQVKTADDYAISYLGRHFSNPEQVWSGGRLGDFYANYDLRKGISGWAKAAYDLAKAARLSPVDADSVITPDVDFEMAKNGGNVEDDIAAADKMLSMSSVTSTAQSKQENIEKEARLTGKIAWEVGANAAKVLAAAPEKWGTPTKPFPIWNDIKSFYNQYLNGKYENIEKYLEVDAEQIRQMLMNSTNPDAAKILKEKGQKLSALDKEVEKANAESQQKLKSATAARKSSIDAKVSLLKAQKADLLAQMDEPSAYIQQARNAIADWQDEQETKAAKAKYKNVHADEFANWIGASSSTVSKGLAVEKEESAIVNPLDAFKKEEAVQDTPVETVPQNIPETGNSYELPAIEDYSYQYIHEKKAENPEGANAQEPEGGQEDENAEEDIPLSFNLKFIETLAFAAEDNRIYLQLMDGLNDGTISLDGIREEISKREQKINNLQKEADRIDNEIANLRAVSHQKAKEEASGIKSVLAKFLSEIRAKKEKAQQDYSVNEISTGDELADQAAKAAREIADKAIANAVGDLYARIAERISQTKKELANMGDNLYLPEGHDKVVEIHQRLMRDLRALPLTVRNTTTGAIATLYMYEKLFPADTTAEEEAYFVGLPPKERDLKAPKAAPYAKLAPMREIFYFDEVDRHNAQPDAAEEDEALPVTADDFLNYGGEVPEIWKLMLSENPFVEKEFNLAKALNSGCSETIFFQGQAFPCKVKGTATILAPGHKGKLLQVSGKNLPRDLKECANIAPLAWDRFYKSDDEYEFIAAPTNDDIFCPYSELGTILDADGDNNLQFRATSNNAFQNAINRSNSASLGNEDESSEVKIKEYIYGQAMYNVNQIGEFLKVTEMEQEYRQNVDELRQKIDEANKTLKELLQKFGFDPGSSYDIANEKDFKLTRTKLLDFRSQKMNTASSGIGEINTAGNEVVEERVRKFNDILDALKKDKEALVNINATVGSDTSLDEQIKTAKANNSVDDAYGKTADDFAKKNLDAVADMYFAIY